MELVVRADGREEQVVLERVEGGYRVQLGERSYQVDMVDLGGSLRSLLIEGRQYEVAVLAQDAPGQASAGRLGARYLVSGERRTAQVELMDPLSHLARQARGGEDGGAGSSVVQAYMPGRVVKLLANEGDQVEAGQGVVVLEAMKMENEIQAERAGTLSKISVQEGQAVEGGDPLFELE